MLKNKPKFIYFVIIFIVTIIFIWAFSAIFFRWVDRNTYVELISGKWYLNDIPLDIWKREKVSKKDVIETKTEDSMAIIEWWDWSLTRLWGNTRILVEEEFVSKNKNEINILFSLESGKTWSNVISFMWEDSYFKQKFNDTEAAVRWTIYAVDLEKNYLFVEKHKVELKNEEIWNLEISENKPYDILEFKFIWFEDFIKFFKDYKFFEINQALDKQYFLALLKNIERNMDEFSDFAFKEIKNLSDVEIEKLYKEFLEKYQELNFISPNNSPELFDLKIKIKEKMLSLANENEKKIILKTLNYDLKDIFDSKQFYGFENIINILNENKEFINIETMKEYFDIFNIKFEIWETIDVLIDNFNKNIVNTLEWKKFEDSFVKTIKEQKNFFMKFWDYLKKDLFN